MLRNTVNVKDVLKTEFCFYLAQCEEEKVSFSSKETHMDVYFLFYKFVTMLELLAKINTVLACSQMLAKTIRYP